MSLVRKRAVLALVTLASVGAAMPTASASAHPCAYQNLMPTSFNSAKISSQDWDPNLGFFTSGAFIGDYNGLAASNHAVYAVWTDGRNDAIGETGLGETDIFTKVQHGH